MGWRTAVAGQAALVGVGAAAWSWNRRPLPKGNGRGSTTCAQVQEAVHDVVRASRSYGMVCCCPSGDAAPTCRLMDLHACADERLRFHLVTRPWTRKATQLRAVEGVTITFHDPREGGENGYAALSGRVRELTQSVARRAAARSKRPIGSARARLLRLLRARPAALGGSALPGRGPATGSPATARASRLQTCRFHITMQAPVGRVAGRSFTRALGRAPPSFGSSCPIRRRWSTIGSGWHQPGVRKR